MSGTEQNPPRNLVEASRYRGIYGRVARQLGLSVGHVRFVALGERHSRRVEEALRSEMDRIDRELGLPNQMQ